MKRALLLLFALLAVPSRAQDAAHAIPPATIDNSLEVQGETIRARKIETRLSVPVDIDGQGPFRFIVDSGADRSVIGAALAQRLALPTGNPVLLQGMGGPSTVATVHIERLKLGTSEIPGITAPALDEANLGAQGLIGIDALAEQRLMLDFEAHTITVQDARRPEPLHGDEIIVTARRRKGQLILTELTVDAERVFAVIDTGTEVTMGNSALRARLFGRRQSPPVTQVTLVSVTGQPVVADVIVIPLLRLGGLTLRNVPVAFSDAPPFRLFGLANDPAMLLGTDVLEGFRRVSLDFRRRKVRFALRR